MRTRYTVTAERDGRRWLLRVPELPGVFSQATRLDQAEHMARDAIALMLDVSPDSFDVGIEPTLGAGEALERALTRVLADQDSAAIAEHVRQELAALGAVVVTRETLAELLRREGASDLDADNMAAHIVSALTEDDDKRDVSEPE